MERARNSESKTHVKRYNRTSGTDLSYGTFFLGPPVDFLHFPSELSAAAAKRGMRSLSVKTVPSRRSTLAHPDEGRHGPSDADDDNGGK